MKNINVRKVIALSILAGYLIQSTFLFYISVYVDIENINFLQLIYNSFMSVFQLIIGFYFGKATALDTNKKDSL